MWWLWREWQRQKLTLSLKLYNQTESYLLFGRLKAWWWRRWSMVVEKLNEPKCVSYYWCVLSATVIVLPVAECLKPARVFLFFFAFCCYLFFSYFFSSCYWFKFQIFFVTVWQTGDIVVVFHFFFLIFGDFAACHHCHPPLHMSAPWSLALTLHRAHHLHPTGLCRQVGVVGQKLQKRVTDAKRQNNIIQHYPNGNGNWHLCYTLFQVRLRHHWLPHITLRPQPVFTCTRNDSSAGRPAGRQGRVIEISVSF